MQRGLILPELLLLAQYLLTTFAFVFKDSFSSQTSCFPANVHPAKRCCDSPLDRPSSPLLQRSSSNCSSAEQPLILSPRQQRGWRSRDGSRLIIHISGPSIGKHKGMRGSGGIKAATVWPVKKKRPFCKASTANSCPLSEENNSGLLVSAVARLT